MEEMFLVYKTDSHHSYASRDIIGVCVDLGRAIAVCIYKATKEGEKITKAQLVHLRQKKQTQGYFGDGEFVIEAVRTNILL